MPEPTATSHAIDGAGVGHIREELRALRKRIRGLLVFERGAWIAAGTIGACVAVGLIDYLTRTPSWLRLAVLLLGVIAILWSLRRFVLPALRFGPALTEIALRVESSERGRDAGLSGVLASGLELEETSRGDGLVADLARPVVADASDRFDAINARSIARPGRARRALGGLAIGGAVVVLLAMLTPTLAGIGASRVLMPWAGAEWPKRTMVASATNVEIHPLGTALPLRAVLTKGPSDTRVVAKYRVVVDGEANAIRRVVLTGQGREIEASGPAGKGVHGELFERLVEPTGLAAGSRDGDDSLEVVLEYWFETDDDRSPASSLTLVVPPSIRGASASIDPPGYLDGLMDTRERTVDLGSGRDERAAPEPILAGSLVEVTIELNKPVPSPGDGTTPVAMTEAWLTSTLGPDVAALAVDSASFSAIYTPTEWTLNWQMEDSVYMPVRVVDSYGIESVEESSFRFDASKDVPPTATVTAPDEDRSVLPTAVVSLTGEGRDDIALRRVELHRQTARRPADSEGAPPEPEGEPVTIAARAAEDASADPEATVATRLVVTESLDLSQLELEPGDELWVTAVAIDAYELAGARHEPVRSSVRVLRVIAEEDLIEQVWQELAAVRRGAIRIDEQQEELMRAAGRAGDAERQQRTQAGLTERIAKQRELLERVGERLDENGLRDDDLDGVLREADSLQQRAGQASVRAGEGLQEAGEQQSSNEAMEAEEETLEEIDEAQTDVRDALADLIELLDQGEDIWTIKRSVERLLSEQASLRDRTQQMAEQTTGRSADELTPQEREELSQLADEQRTLAERAEEAIREMQRREQEMRESDPAASEAMAQAARTGQRQQVSERMETAGEQLDENQSNAAQDQQDQAMEALEEMLENLDDTARNRDEVLRRILASLIDSIRGLISQQESQLARAVDAVRAGDALADVRPPLDLGMSRLHQNTLGVLDEASRSPREVAPVTRLIERAAEAQVAAVVALRDDPIDEDEVQAQEEISLDKLEEALAEAERLDQEAENRQKARERDEIKKAYDEALREQLRLLEETEPLVGREATRRLKATARRLSGEQGVLIDRMEELLENTSELRDATVIAFAHKRLYDAMSLAMGRLGKGDADRVVTRNQRRAVRILQGIIEALAEDEEDQEFREQQQQGGEGGGQSGEEPLIPPIAELKLLRSMQQEAVDMTRELTELEEEDRVEQTEHVGELQRELSDEGTRLLRRLSEGGAPTGVEPIREEVGDEPDAGDGEDEPEGPSPMDEGGPME